MKNYSLTAIVVEGLIPGDETKKKTPMDVINKNRITMDSLKQKLKKGIAVEKEHSNDLRVAAEIALDHLYEDPMYYDKLNKTGLEEFNSDIPGRKMYDSGDHDDYEGLDLKTAMAEAQKISKQYGVAQHVNQIGAGDGGHSYEVSDWFDSEQTVCSYQNGFKMNEQSVKEQPNETLDGQLVKMIKQGVGVGNDTVKKEGIKFSEIVGF